MARTGSTLVGARDDSGETVIVDAVVAQGPDDDEREEAYNR